MWTGDLVRALAKTRRPYPEFQILWAIILSIPVFVVHTFSRLHSPTKHLRHHDPMFHLPGLSARLFWLPDIDIAILVDMPRWSV